MMTKKKILIILVSVLWTLTGFSQFLNKIISNENLSSSFVWQIYGYQNTIIANIESQCSNSNLCINFTQVDNLDNINYSAEIMNRKGFYNNMVVRNDTIFYSSNEYNEKDSINYWVFGLMKITGQLITEYKYKTLHFDHFGIGSFGYVYPRAYGLTLVNNNEIILWGEGLDNRQPNPGTVPYRSVFLRVGLDGSQKGDIFWFDLNDESERRMSDATTDIDGNMVFHYEWRNTFGNTTDNRLRRGVFKVLENDSIVKIGEVPVGQIGHDNPKIAIDGIGNYFINTLEQGHLPEFGIDAFKMTYLSKIDQFGKEQWRKIIKPYESFFLKGIQTTNMEMVRISTTQNGDVLCVGNVLVQDSFYMADLDKKVHLSGDCSFMSRFDTDGNMLWRYFIVPRKKDGGVRNNYIYDIQESPDGSIIVGGQLERDDDLPGYKGDAWLMRLSPDGCLNDACDHIGKYWDFPKDIVATDDIQADKVKVYPNPGVDDVWVQNSETAILPIQYQIMDSQGRILTTGSQNTTRFNLNVDNLPVGLYHVLIKDKIGKIWTSKWVKGK